MPRGDTAGAVLLLRDVRVTVGDRDLLVDANLRVEPGETVALVGANGCGKSTLLRAVAGWRGADAGDLLVAHRADVGYLEQTAVSGSRRTVAEEARSRMTHVADAEARLADAEARMRRGERGAEARFQAAQDAWDAAGGVDVERRVADVLAGLGFAREAWDRPCDALSGGWQMRVALARLLLSPAGDQKAPASANAASSGFLLLDEPTNHLDARAKAWLAGWLRAYPGTVLLVSHDEALLEGASGGSPFVDRLVEVRAAKLHAFKGGYRDFLEARVARRRAAERAADKAKAKAAKLERFVAKNSARASTAAAARSRAKQLEGVRTDLEALAEETATGGGALGEGPGDRKRVSLTLPPAPAGAREALALTDATVGYGAGLEPLIADATLTVARGDRLLIVGPNGAGKSTLLKTLAGHLRLLGGRLERGDGAVVGYFSQDLAQELPSDATPLAHVLRVARRASPSTTEQRARSVLGALGLSGGAAKDRLIGQLSGGEKARVALAAFVLRPVNVLLLDEASNHLDVAAIDALTDALRGWDGAVVAVTHNRTFADALEPTRVARVEAGRMSLRTPAGGKLSRRDFSPDAGNTGGVAGAERSEDAGSSRDGDGGAAGVDPEEAEAAERAARDAARALEKTRREARNAPKIIEKIERALAVIDDDVAAIDERLLACGADVAAAQEVQKERDAKTQKAELYYAEWERLEAVMAEAEAAEAVDAR